MICLGWCVKDRVDERESEKGRRRKGTENERVCVRVRGEEAISLVVGVTYLRLVVCEASRRSKIVAKYRRQQSTHMWQNTANGSVGDLCTPVFIRRAFNN